MKIDALLNLANAVRAFKKEINNISNVGETTSILLHEETFFELFQTYTETEIESNNGKIYSAKICGVEFKCVVFEEPTVEAA